MTGYTFTIDCPTCGDNLDHIAGGGDGGDQRGVARCSRCNQEWIIQVVMARAATSNDTSRGRPSRAKVFSR